MAIFADRFIDARLAGLGKDIKICLTGVPSLSRTGKTHAYFPALSACCSALEYLTALHQGRLSGIGWRQVNEFAEDFLPKPDYDEDVVRVLFEALRHPIAHRGIATGLWIDRSNGPGRGRRVTWKIYATSKRPACFVKEESGLLGEHPPWACPYTHRVHIHLRALWVDLRNAANAYRRELASNVELQDRFAAVMRRLYPT